MEYVQRGTTHSAHAAREVILAGGVINTPQLLMLSGIGDPAELKAVGIDARVALSGVGKNLQDHISAPIAYARNEPGPLHRAMRLDRIARELATAYFLGKGIATDLPDGGTISCAVQARLSGRLRHPRRVVTAGEPWFRAVEIRRSV